jgi:hypothetical protein
MIRMEMEEKTLTDRRQLRAYIALSLQTGRMETISSSQQLVTILGYEYQSDIPLNLNHIHNVHIQRAREIIGPAVLNTMDLCRGFWGKELDPNAFWQLVELYKNHGGIASAEFGNVSTDFSFTGIKIWA